MQTAVRLPMLSATQSRTPVKATSDEALIEMIARGDKRAMELLFARYNVRIYRFIARLTGNMTLAEDVVSEVFLDVWRCARNFKSNSQVSTWLLSIARHKALTSLRRPAETSLDGDEAAAAIVDNADGPEARAHNKSCRSVIQKCLMQLSAEQREVIDLVYYHQKTIAEVALITGAPEGTVKTRTFRARVRLSHLLKGWRVQDLQTT